MAQTRYPTADGLRHALTALGIEGSAPRRTNHLPVLLAVEAGVLAGQEAQTPDGLAGVPTLQLFPWLDRWFDVSGDGRDYLIPFPVSGQQRRDEGIVAQNGMTSAQRQGFIRASVPLPAPIGGTYPIVDLEGWREYVSEGFKDGGVDLALLGVWLARTTGVTADLNVPTRGELESFALSALGVPAGGATHPLVATTPPILTTGGEDSWTAEHFSDTELPLNEVAAVANWFAPGKTTAGGTASSTLTAIDDSDSELWLPDGVREMLQVSIASSKAVMLVGPPGTGKTELVREAAERLKTNPESYLIEKEDAAGGAVPRGDLLIVTPDDEWSSSTLVGNLTLDEKGGLTFRPGYVLQAIQNNSWILLDEANRGDLDKIFGGLMTWLTSGVGNPVRVGMTSTRHDAKPVFLEWSDEDECRVEGLEGLEAGAIATVPVKFIAGKSWRFLGTFNPVDAQRVFKLGQALGRRFRRVPVPPPSVEIFRKMIEKRCPDLSDDLRNAVVQIYAAHNDRDLAFQPLLGPAPFLSVAAYISVALTTSDPSPSDPGAPEDEAADDELAGEAALTPGLAPADSKVLTQAYVTSFGTWLSQLNSTDLKKVKSALVPGIFSSADWTWLEEMVRSL